jgi:hypothetical protein
MSRRKGERKKWQVEAEFPFCVEVEVGSGGDGWPNRYQLLAYWPLHHCGRDRTTQWGRRDGLRDFCGFWFKDGADAERFRAYISVVMAMTPHDAQIWAARVRDGEPHSIETALPPNQTQ